MKSQHEVKYEIVCNGAVCGTFDDRETAMGIAEKVMEYYRNRNAKGVCVSVQMVTCIPLTEFIS